MEIDASSLVQNFMNSKLTALLASKLYGSSATAAMPDSTRRPFISRMRLDSRVALQGAQNMEDAASMVTIAQSDTTAIKDKLNDMLAKAVEGASSDSLSASEYAMIQDGLKSLAKDIVGIAKSSRFNGINLMDGSATVGTNGKIQLQAGNSSKDQALINMLDTGVANGSVIGTDGNLNFNNLSDLLGGDWKVTDQASAAKLRDNLQEIVYRIEGVEAQYSYDIKSLKNTSLLLQNQADILDTVQKNHSAASGNDKEAKDAASASSSALSDLLGGNIMSAIS